MLETPLEIEMLDASTVVQKKNIEESMKAPFSNVEAGTLPLRLQEKIIEVLVRRAACVK